MAADPSPDRAPPWRRMPARTRGAVGGVMLSLVTVSVVGQALADRVPAGVVAADAAVGVVGLLLLPWLVAGSVGTSVAVAILGTLSPAATPLAATAVLWVARRRPLPTAVAVAGTSAAAMLLRGVLRPAPGIDIGWWAVLVVTLHAALLGWGLAVRTHRALVGTLVERAEHAEQTQADRVAEARRAERTRIAREMHDVLAHRLSLLTTYAGALEYRRDTPPDQVRDAAGLIRAAAHQALDDLRDVIIVLREEEKGLGARRPAPDLLAVPDLVDEWQRAGTAVRLVDRRQDPDRSRVPDLVGRTVFRVVQEALTNAHKHAPDAPVEVELSGRPGDHIGVVVSNPTAPSDVGARDVAGGGYGLTGLQERCDLAGGTLDHGPAPDGTFRVRAWLPWPA